MEIKGKDNYDVAFTVNGTVVSVDTHTHNHDALTNFVANEHIDHSSLSVIAGEGLAGGGDLTASRTVNLDINGLAADASPDGAADYIATYDASGPAHKKVILNDLPGGGGSLTFTEHFSFIPDSSWIDGIWNTVTLSGISGPCLVEIFVTNENETIRKTGGIREIGSSLDRKRSIGKYEPLCFNVYANSSNQVEIYTQKKNTTDFYLIGEYS